MKGVAAHQLEAVTDATASLGKGLKKSIKTYRKEANRFARNLGEFVDVEDLLKSINRVANSDDYEDRKSSIIHTPIDWSKRPPSTRGKTSDECSVTIVEECEDEDEGNEQTSTSKGNTTSSGMVRAPSSDQQKSNGLLKNRLLGVDNTKSKKMVCPHSPKLYRKKLMR